MAGVNDACEIVLDKNLRIQRGRAQIGLTVEFHHHRHFHRAGGVEDLIGFDQHLRSGVEVVKGHGDGFSAALADQRVNRLFEPRGATRSCLRGKNEVCAQQDRDSGEDGPKTSGMIRRV